MFDSTDHHRPSLSADVRMVLAVNGQKLTVGHLAPDYVLLDNPIDHPPTDAEICLTVDGRQERWPVRLVEGLSTTKPKAVIVSRS
ncbi:MAG: hypothetical protein WD851_22990 [Pirellulales bacterium]